MNIAIGKIGKSIKFNVSSWGAIGGDVEAPTLFYRWAEMNPQHNFYIIGKSDYSRAKNIKRLPNIIDVWEFAEKDMTDTEKRDFVIENLDGINIDFAVLYGGPLGRGNIHDYTPVLDNSRMTKCLGFQINYVSPILYFINETNVPWFMLSVDSRFFPQRCVDIVNMPLMSYSQINTTGDYLRMSGTSFEERHKIVKDTIDAFYSAIETVFLMHHTKPTREEYFSGDRSGMNFILNEGGNRGLERGPYLEEYILRYSDDVSVFGKWKSHWVDDHRFKGSIPFERIGEVLAGTKYTFIIPIGKGWATAKYWEMAHHGVLPFFHPWYDEQENIPAPEFLRVNSPEELWEKIELLENNNELYLNILEEVYETLDDDYYDGTHVNNILNHMCGQILGDIETPKL
jgi:hypothetical protein